MPDTKRQPKQRSLPEAGQMADRVAPFALIVGIVLTTVGFFLAFFYAAPVNGAEVYARDAAGNILRDSAGNALPALEEIGGQLVSNVLLISQKIFYFHMPVALVSFLALAVAAFYCVRFLMTKQQRYDTCARISMEIALVFVICTMITGEMWTRFEWGVWWTWEPRLTTYLILMLVVIAYFVLRNALDDPERCATYAAVVGIIAFVDVPICFMITRLVPSSVHPVVLREGGMSADMGITLVLVLIGMLCVAFALYRMRFRQVRMQERVEALKAALDEE